MFRAAAPHACSRVTVLIAIAAAHAALIALIAPVSSRSTAAASSLPIEVTLAQEDRLPIERPKIVPPLVPPTWTAIEPPLLDLPVEPARPAAITTAAVEVTPAPAPVGRPVTITEVSYRHPPRPRYPAESRRAGEQGLVLLLVTIDEAGRAARIEIQRSSGHPRLDAAARDAVAQALFKPYVENGIARAVLATIPIEFNWTGRRS